MLEYNCKRKPGIKELKKPKTVVFEDGTQEEIDEIVCCTGFANEFDYLRNEEGNDPEHSKLLRRVANDARISHNLYKHCVHPEMGDELFFIGFVRPCFGAIPPLAELQARWFALLCSKKVSLPSKDILYKHSQMYVKYIQNYLTAYRTDRIVNLTDFISYSDDMSRLIGCRPNFVEMFFKQPLLWLKCQIGPQLNAHYRLYGPHANKKQAEEIIMGAKWKYNFINFSFLFMTFFNGFFHTLFGIKCLKPYTWYPIIDYVNDDDNNMKTTDMKKMK